MEQLKTAVQQMITITEDEMTHFLKSCFQKTFQRKEILSYPNIIPNEIFFIESGIIRVMLQDREGKEHTLHFALEQQFVADYAHFMNKTPSVYALQALEPTSVVVLSRTTIEWGYQHLQEGDKLGRLIAESYFIYHDHRIQDMYVRTPKERYDAITQVFPAIHARVPQHMIASYLGITSVHLSRLKKQAIKV
ncbi:MAG: Crp/Fnr family transcriptional regulator [Thermonemataceae bacterium]